MGKEIADALAHRLNVPVITRDFVMSHWLPEVASKHELHMLEESPAFFLKLSSQATALRSIWKNRLKDYLLEQPAIVFGLGAQIIFAQDPAALHIKYCFAGSPGQTYYAGSQSGEKNAERFLELTDRKHKKYISTLYGRDWSDPLLYHIVLNTDFLSVEKGASLLHFMAENMLNGAPSPSDSSEKEEIKPVVSSTHLKKNLRRSSICTILSGIMSPELFP